MQNRRASRRILGLRAPAGGFTLVELLVVIGLIVLIIGIALPSVLHALKTGRRTRTVADFQLIGTALEAYKADFGDYPRFDDGNAADAQSLPTPQSADPINIQQDRGARLLCRALLAPAGAVLTTGTASTSFGFNNSNGTASEQAPDGAAGPGFRTRPPAVDANGNIVSAGPVYGPYIQSDKFRLGNPGAPGGKWDSTYFTDATLLDPEGNPILYYPATPGVTGYTNGGTGGTGGTSGNSVPTFYVCPETQGVPQGNTTPPLCRTLYNSFDNEGYGETVPPTYFFLKDSEMQALMGDANNNGYIDSGEQATTTRAYLLWSAGEDGVFGRTPQLGNRTDDVTNFDIPPNLVKY